MKNCPRGITGVGLNVIGARTESERDQKRLEGGRKKKGRMSYM